MAPALAKRLALPELCSPKGAHGRWQKAKPKPRCGTGVLRLLEAFQAGAYRPYAGRSSAEQAAASPTFPVARVAPQHKLRRRALQHRSSVLRCPPRKTAHTQHFKALRA